MTKTTFTPIPGAPTNEEVGKCFLSFAGPAPPDSCVVPKSRCDFLKSMVKDTDRTVTPEDLKRMPAAMFAGSMTGMLVMQSMYDASCPKE